MKDLYYIESVRQFEESTMALLQYIPKNIKKWELANRDFNGMSENWLIRGGKKLFEKVHMCMLWVTKNIRLPMKTSVCHRLECAMEDWWIAWYKHKESYHKIYLIISQYYIHIT